MNAAEAKLVEALRSGRYSQIGGGLKKRTVDGDKFCCLGVACDVYDPTRWTTLTSDGTNYYKFNTEDDLLSPDGNVGYLPRTVRQHLNWLHDSGVFTGHPTLGEGDLARLNDMGHSFEEIACVIEGGYIVKEKPE